MEWDWNFVWEIMPTLLEGLKITILATVFGAALAAIIGLVFAILRMTAP
jgi:polar amino acid transport system permease protein